MARRRTTRCLAWGSEAQDDEVQGGDLVSRAWFMAPSIGATGVGLRRQRLQGVVLEARRRMLTAFFHSLSRQESDKDHVKPLAPLGMPLFHLDPSSPHPSHPRLDLVPLLLLFRRLSPILLPLNCLRPSCPVSHTNTRRQWGCVLLHESRRQRRRRSRL